MINVDSRLKEISNMFGYLFEKPSLYQQFVSLRTQVAHFKELKCYRGRTQMV
jgi:hypothetical protein